MSRSGGTIKLSMLRAESQYIKAPNRDVRPVKKNRQVKPPTSNCWSWRFEFLSFKGAKWKAVKKCNLKGGADQPRLLSQPSLFGNYVPRSHHEGAACINLGIETKNLLIQRRAREPLRHQGRSTMLISYTESYSSTLACDSLNGDASSLSLRSTTNE